jgi:hypothetical protein
VQVRERAHLSPAQIVGQLAAITPFALDLTGPAGGTYAHDPKLPEAEHLSLDAVNFCRTLAGRGHPAGLRTTIVPF